MHPSLHTLPSPTRPATRIPARRERVRVSPDLSYGKPRGAQDIPGRANRVLIYLNLIYYNYHWTLKRHNLLFLFQLRVYPYRMVTTKYI